MIARNIAPGLTRHFRIEEFPFYKRELLMSVREEAKKKVYPSGAYTIVASDNDEGMIKIAKGNAKRAGVGEEITFKVQDLLDENSKMEISI